MSKLTDKNHCDDDGNRHREQERENQHEREHPYHSDPAVEEEQTRIYLATNGPRPGAFEPNIPPELLQGKGKGEVWLYEKVDSGDKKNDWQIREIIGLKGAHRQLHSAHQEINSRLERGDERFEQIEKTTRWIEELRTSWKSRRKMFRNVLIGVLTLFLLPFLSVFAEDLLKRWLGWK